jgi:excisionase family DNA binding protein
MSDHDCQEHGRSRTEGTASNGTRPVRASLDTRKRWITPQDVAEMLSITDREVTNMLKGGELPGVKLGRLWRIPLAEFDQWVERQELEGMEITGYGAETRI